MFSVHTRRAPSLAFFLGLTVLTAEPLAPQGPVSQTPAATQRYFLLTRPAFSGARARDVVAFMDDYFRLPGNTGFNATIYRVEDIVKAAGYVEETKAPKGARLTYRIEHRPMSRPTWEPVNATLSIVGESAPVLSYATNRNMIAINSASTPVGGVTAEVIDVGNGTVAELDRVPLTGKIVIANGGIGRLYTEAAKRGAIGALAHGLPAYNKPEINRNSIQFQSISDTTGRGWGLPISLNALERIRAALAKGPVQLHVETKTKMYESEELTLIAEVHCSVKERERFVVSAHIQEPGANDNASGVATLSEMARVMGGLVHAGRIDPKRSITMLFGDEIKQTSDYLKGDSIRTRGVLWGLSLDMVGEDTKKTGGTFLIEKMPDPSAIWTRGEDKHSEWGGRPLTKDRLVFHYFNDFLLARCLDQAATNGWVVKTNPFEGGSDHTPFLTHKKPGVLFWHFTDQFYHTDGDRLVNVSAETMSNVGNAALASVLTLTSADGATARALVAELEMAANQRIGAELALSRAALKADGTMAKELDIVTTWIDYYAKSIESMQDIEVGGSSPATKAAIAAAAARVRAIKPALGS
ncbi:MAG: M28 family peptidase [Longimicrobiales bacterium]